MPANCCWEYKSNTHKMPYLANTSHEYLTRNPKPYPKTQPYQPYLPEGV